MRHSAFRFSRVVILPLLAFSMCENVFAQGRIVRPPLFFHEEWKQTPAGGEHPVTQDGVANPSLELKLYGIIRQRGAAHGQRQGRKQPDSRLDRALPTPCAVALRAQGQLRRSDGSRPNPLGHQDVRVPSDSARS